MSYTALFLTFAAGFSIGVLAMWLWYSRPLTAREIEDLDRLDRWYK